MATNDKLDKKEKRVIQRKEELIRNILFAVLSIALFIIGIILLLNLKNVILENRPEPSFDDPSLLVRPTEDEFQTVDFKTIRALSDAVFPDVEVRNEEFADQHLITPAQKALGNSFWFDPSRDIAYARPYYYIINTNAYIRYDRDYERLTTKFSYVTPFLEIIIKKALERQKPKDFLVHSIRNTLIARKIRDEINFYLQFPKSYMNYFIGDKKNKELFLSLPLTLEADFFEDELLNKLNSSQQTEIIKNAYHYDETNYYYALTFDPSKARNQPKDTAERKLYDDLEDVFMDLGYMIRIVPAEQYKEVNEKMMIESVIFQNFIAVKRYF